MSNTIRRGARVLAAATFVLFGACQSDPVAGPQSGPDDLSGNEAAAISDFLVNGAFGAWDLGSVGGGGGGGAALRSGVPISIDYSIDVTEACPFGGDLTVVGAISGSIDDQTLAGSLDLDVSTSATNCGFQYEETEFTLNTNPDLVLSGGFSFDQGQLVGESTFTYTGTVHWVSDSGRSGSCSYDMEVTQSASGALVSSGTVCSTTI